MMKKNDFNLLGDVARTLGCKPYQITYLLTSGQVPEPAMRLGNRRVFRSGDIQRLAAKLGIEQRKEKHEQ
jgi:hypothetical protein